MGLILTLILGGLAGWIASMIVGRDGQQGALLNIVVGIVGAVLANLFLAPLLGVSAVLDSISLMGFLVAVAGATILLVIVNLIQGRGLKA